MKGRKYEDSKGRTITVQMVENNIAVLNNGERVAVERLKDNKFYTPINSDEELSTVVNKTINENNTNSMETIESFDNPPNRYQQLIDGFQHNKSTNVGINEESTINHNQHSSIQGNNPMVTISGANSVVESHRANVGHQEEPGKAVPVVQPFRPQIPIKTENTEDIYSDNLENRTNTPIDPEEALLNKYKHLMPETSNSLDKIVHGEISDSKDNNIPIPNANQPTPITEIEENPVHQMFDKAKKTHSINVNLKLNEKIPEKGIIKMMEENFDDSAIDYYTNQIYKKLMANPKIIEDQVREAIDKYVNSRTTKAKPKTKTKPKTKK